MLKVRLFTILMVYALLPVYSWGQYGDILYYKGAFSDYIPNNTLEHSVIDTGDGFVIEFIVGANGSRTKAPVITRTSMRDFIKASKTGQIYTFNVHQRYPGVFVRTRQQTVECAKQYLANGGKNFGIYNPLTRNCQHFAMFCKTGVLASWQIEDLHSFFINPIRYHNRTTEAVVDITLGAIDLFSEVYFAPYNTSAPEGEVLPRSR